MIDELALPEAVKEKLLQFSQALQGSLGQRLISLTLYGSAARGVYRPRFSDLNLLLVLESVSHDDLSEMEREFTELRGTVNATPYLLTLNELPRVVAAFPTRFLEMKRGYRVLVGQDVLAGIEVDRKALESRCEQELLNVLLRFRHLLLMGAGGGVLEQAMRRVLPPFIKTLRTLVYLQTGENVDDRDRLMAVAADRFGIPPGAFSQLLAWRREELHLQEHEWREAAPHFLEGVEKVVASLRG